MINWRFHFFFSVCIFFHWFSKVEHRFEFGTWNSNLQRVMYYIAGYVMYVARKQVQNFTLLVTLWKSRQQQLTRTLLPALGMEKYLLIPIVFNTFQNKYIEDHFIMILLSSSSICTKEISTATTTTNTKILSVKNVWAWVSVIFT